MKQVKIILGTVLIFLAIASGVVFNACTKDPCKDVSCKNNGVCRDGRCKCGEGFEGAYCEIRMYEKFIGTWQGTYRCNGDVPSGRMVIIAPGEKGNAISLYNIFTQNQSINAIVNGYDIVLEEQTVGNIVYRGNGRVEGLYITLYVEEHNLTTGIRSTCVLNATKFVNP